MTIAMITHNDCALHEAGAEHPERPARLSAINDKLVSSGMSKVLAYYQADDVTREQLLSVHDKDYIDDIFRQAPKRAGVYVQLDEDTVMMNKSLAAARKAAGAGIKAVDLVLGNKHKKAFCAVRPPGHHAEKDKAMGFCVFNSIAVAAEYAMSEYGIKRIAIVDFDVHHGNGTENIVGGDQRILFCSSFESPLYPFSGEQTPFDNVVNIPLSAGIGGAAFQDLVVAQWFDRIDAFAPELIMISAGFDAHAEDNISTINLVEQDYRNLTVELKKLADKHAQGRIVSMLEGGYSLSALGRSVYAHLDGLF